MLKRLRWFALGGLLLFMIGVEAARIVLRPYTGSVAGNLVMDLAVLFGMMILFGFFFEQLGQLYRRVERQNRELEALRIASVAVYGELALDAVLQRVVEQARSLLGAHYGAISVLDAGQRILAFVTSGISPEERERIGRPPEGRGVLGVPLLEGQRIRLANLGAHPRSVGFPPNHPPMSSLLAVPITCRGPFRGNLYLAESRSSEGFTEEDETALVRFAEAAAVAIEIAHLHERLRSLAVAEERLHLAHEMHDGMAQILAYVNTKALAVDEYLKQGKTAEAKTQIGQLSVAAREVYADVREGILGLRVGIGEPGTFAETLRRYVDHWRDQNEIEATVEIDPEITLAPPVELQVVRIVQEALANVRKHSRAHRVRISIESADGLVRVTVADDGVGFDPSALGRSAFPRFGLSTMRERAQSVGGILRVDTTPGEGSQVVAELPIVAGSSSEGGIP
ncbi:MAG TPA: GAF domain-containing sensor histidine kinase [Thermoanaerobaculia bacterium]|nr:GAF domain-containing sensor histidine kinase [Thermoanaerobaculia bacterium]